MASTTEEPEGPEGVEFIRENDGTITARDLGTGLALQEGRGESIDDPEAFLRDELSLNPKGLDGDRELPEFLR